MLFGFNGRATRNFLALLVVMHFILFIDRVNLAAAASVMQQDLGLSNIALGVAFSAFNYAYAPFQLIGGWFADRFGERRRPALPHSVRRQSLAPARSSSRSGRWRSAVSFSTSPVVASPHYDTGQ